MILARLTLVLLAFVVQLAAAYQPDSSVVWGLYALAAVGAGVLLEPSRRTTPWIEAPAASPRHTGQMPALARVLLVLLSVTCASLATEWSTIYAFPARTLAIWLATFAALSAAAWRLRVSPRLPNHDSAPKYEKQTLIGILIVALLLRTLWIDELPRVYFGDESRAGMWVHTAFRNGMPNLLTMGWNTWSMVGLSLQAMLSPWLGLNTVSMRLASALFGSVAVFATYLLTREIFDRRLALLAAALLACNRTAIDFSRLGTTHAQVMLFETFAFFALWRAVNTGSAIAYAWSGLLAALCLHTYNAAHAVPALLLGWFGLACLVRPRRLRTFAAGATIALGSFALVSLPWLYYLTDHYQFSSNWLQFTWMARARQVTPQILAAYHDGGISAAWPLVATQAWKTWLGFTILPAEAYQLGYRGGGMLDHVGAALFVLGLALALRAGTRGLFLLYWVGVTAFFGGVLTIDPPAFVRLVGLIPAVCILAALPLRALLGAAPSRSWLGPVCAIALVVAAFADNWRTYFVDYAASSAEETSELIHFVRKLPPESPVYILGADDFLHFTHDVNVEQFAFDFPDRKFEDTIEPGRFLPIRKPQAEVPTYLVFGPTQLALEPYIRRLYPNSEGHDVRHKDNHRLFFRYLELTPEDLQAQAHAHPKQGLSATYERDGRTLTQRIDPQLNFFTNESLFLNTSRLTLMAPFHAHWTGALRIDTPGLYKFEVVGGGPFTVELAGERPCSLAAVNPEEAKTCAFHRELPSGTFAIDAQWDAWKTPSSARLLFQMYWTLPDGSRELVPPDHFVPGPSAEEDPPIASPPPAASH